MRTQNPRWLESSRISATDIEADGSHAAFRLLPAVPFLAFLFTLLCFLYPLPAAAQTTGLRVGIYENSPKVFTDDGTPKGIFVDIITDIADAEGWRLEYISGTWAENLERLEKGEIDVLVDMSYSPERAEKYTLSTSPVLESWLDVYAKRDVHIGSIQDLAGRRIAVLKGSVQEKFLSTEIREAYRIDFTLVPYEDYPGAVAAVKSGEADVMVATRFFSFSTIRDEEIVPANVIFRPESLHFAFPRNIDPEVVAAIDRRVAAMQNDPGSAYYKSLQKWMNVQPRMVIPGYLKYLLALISGMLASIAVFALVLRRQVSARTKELKTGNKQLRESEERWRSYVMNAPYGVFLAGGGGRFMEVNPAVCRITGYEEAELLEMSFSDMLISAPDQEAVDGFQALALEAAGHSESVFRNRSGELHWWSVMKVQLSNDRLLGFIEDITERKQAERALLESDLLLRETQALSRLGGWEFDLKAKRIKWTDEVYRIYGVDKSYDPNEISRDISFYAPGDDAIVEAAFWRAVEQGEPYDLELKLNRQDGQRIWVRTTGKPVWENGEVVRITGNIMDITESRLAEEAELKLREQLLLAKRMELVGRLAGGVAHDFNNMLSVITGFTEIALRQADPGHQISADLEQILSAARRATDITRQLLAFARKQSVAPQIVDLNGAVEGMLKMLKRLIGEDICLYFYAAEELWLVKMDPSQIDQILANLCVNSRDAIEDVGQVTIETRNATFDQAHSDDRAGCVPGDFVLLSVSDNGWGMSKETLERIFEPYFTTKELGDGTGLGLATVFGIVKQNGGFIDVFSEPEEGTTFNIYLPRYTGGVAEAKKDDAPDVPRGKGETILLVEDEASILDLARRILEGLGYQVLSATSPTEAQQMAARHPGAIDLLITDVVMPEINGRDLAGRIREKRPGMECLFMSGYTADVIANRGVLDEGVQFIQKPFSRRDLAVKVRGMLDKPEGD